MRRTNPTSRSRFLLPVFWAALLGLSGPGFATQPNSEADIVCLQGQGGGERVSVPAIQYLW